MLLHMENKVFCWVILERIKITLDDKLREEQAGPGFRAGRSCMDQIATLRIILEQSIEWQSFSCINFIDFKKAFDRISREVLWRLLRHYGMPDKVITIIEALYEGGTQWTEDPTIEYNHGGKTRLPAITPTVSGRPGLGDSGSLWREERYSAHL